MKEKVEKVIAEIKTLLQADGGDIELVGIEGKKVKVRLKGACACCPGAAITLRMGVEKKIKEAVPEVESVVAVK